MDATTTIAAHAVYMFVYDAFATSTVEVADLPEVGNTRFAREVLGMLQTAGLVAETEVDGETLWQPWVSHDEENREAAEARIDAWLATDPAAPVKAKGGTSRKVPASRSGLTACLCGCKAMVGGKSAYKPGHDARHASQVAKSLVNMDPAKWDDAVGALPTLALMNKARNQAARLVVKTGNAPKAKAAPKQAPVQVGTVKIGRWTYEAEKVDGADSLRYRKNREATWVGTTDPKHVAAFVPAE